jgi:hypothetical protein
MSSLSPDITLFRLESATLLFDVAETIAAVFRWESFAGTAVVAIVSVRAIRQATKSLARLIGEGEKKKTATRPNHSKQKTTV